jgi:hypothetical protein
MIATKNKSNSSLKHMESNGHRPDWYVIHPFHVFPFNNYFWIAYCKSSIIHLASIDGTPIHPLIG